ncbi:MAG TPA: alpha/beta hydrolase [Ktedonobacteraceae bacterium]|nr:alpha/beta hydrolase [Ktedonobacteraceae bacterium]
MNSKHLVDPELTLLLDYLASQGPDLSPTMESIPQRRAQMKESAALLQTLAPPFPNVTVTERLAPGPQGAPDVRVLVYIPTDASTPLPALLWIHGGGYIVGSADNDDVRAKTMASAVGCAVVSVDYRLAPETPHPGPVEDCYAALKWLHASSGELGVDSARIAIGGGSAGGGLAAALGLLTRDRGEVPLVFQLLIYPMLDDRTVTTAEPNPYAGEFLWTPEANRLGWTALLGQEPGGPDVSPYAAAARADNLAGLPPTWIGVGSIDLFVDENIEYARRLIRAGVPTELRVYPGAPHGFNMIPTARVTQAFEQDLLGALTRALRPGAQA